jgi:hypothetical protein
VTQAKKSTPTTTPEERAAARGRAKEQKAQVAAAESLKAVLDRIAKLEEPDKTNAERIQEVAPSLTPKLLYGSPAYANADGKPVLFYQERARFKGRYANITFFGAAQLDDGTMWPTSWAITDLSTADERLIAKLIRRDRRLRTFSLTQNGRAASVPTPVRRDGAVPSRRNGRCRGRSLRTEIVARSNAPGLHFHDP